jgi:hypothetical protein
MIVGYLICYVTDNGDLYHEQVASKEEVDAWLDENEDYKAIVIAVAGEEVVLTVEDHT